MHLMFDAHHSSIGSSATSMVTLGMCAITIKTTTIKD